MSSNASPATVIVGTPSSSFKISISCQVTFPRQPVFSAFRKASFAANRAA